MFSSCFFVSFKVGVVVDDDMGGGRGALSVYIDMKLLALPKLERDRVLVAGGGDLVLFADSQGWMGVAIAGSGLVGETPTSVDSSSSGTGGCSMSS